MIKTSKILSNIYNDILDGKKVPHQLSDPVIYCEDDIFYFAVFVYFFTSSDIKNGMIKRPTMWVLCDFENGKIIEKRYTKNKEFSDADYETKYSIIPDHPIVVSRKMHEEILDILDSVREKAIKTGILCMDDYKNYMDKLLETIPIGYQRFYKDLSIDY